MLATKDEPTLISANVPKPVEKTTGNIHPGAKKAQHLHTSNRHFMGLVLVLAGTVLVGDFTWLPFKEQCLDDTLIGVDAAIGSRGIAELKSKMAPPQAFPWRQICYDTSPGIRGLADKDAGNVVGNRNVFDCHSESIASCGQDEVFTVVIRVQLGRLQVPPVEGLWIYNGTRYMLEDQKFLG